MAASHRAVSGNNRYPSFERGATTMRKPRSATIDATGIGVRTTLQVRLTVYLNINKNMLTFVTVRLLDCILLDVCFSMTGPVICYIM